MIAIYNKLLHSTEEKDTTLSLLNDVGASLKKKISNKQTNKQTKGQTFKISYNYVNTTFLHVVHLLSVMNVVMFKPLKK